MVYILEYRFWLKHCTNNDFFCCGDDWNSSYLLVSFEGDWKRQTDKQTDRQTDEQTDTALLYVQITYTRRQFAILLEISRDARRKGYSHWTSESASRRTTLLSDSKHSEYVPRRSKHGIVTLQATLLRYFDEQCPQLRQPGLCFASSSSIRRLLRPISITAEVQRLSSGLIAIIPSSVDWHKEFSQHT